MAGTNFRFMVSVSKEIVSQTNKWKGSLKRLVIKNSQAAVPTNSFFGNRIAKKKRLVKAPARLPIMVHMPAIIPVLPANVQ